LVVGENVQEDEPVPGHLRDTIKVDSLDEIFVQTAVNVEKRRVVDGSESLFVDATFFVYLTSDSLFKASPPRLGDHCPGGPFYQGHVAHDFDGLELEKCGREVIFGVRVRDGWIALMWDGKKSGLEDVRLALRVHVDVDVVGGRIR
jgi:hypothetical protein